MTVDRQTLTPMAAAMVDLAGRLGVEIVWPDDRMPTPDELRALPSTHLLERDLTVRRDRAAMLSGRSFGLGYQAAQAQLRVAERQVRWGWLRDEVVMRWNDECACFGDGMMISYADLEPEAVARGQSVIEARHCPCQAGDALRAARRKYAEIRQKQQAEELIVRIFEQTEGEFAEYDGATLSTYRDRLHGYTLSAQTEGKKLADALTDWIKADGAPWLILTGPTGTAKTGLSISLLKLLCLRGQRSLVIREKALLDRIRATYNRTRGSDEPTEQTVLDELRGVPVLLIDDVAAPGSAVSDWAQGQLFDVLNARYSARRRTLMTSNLAAEELSDYLGPRIWSRAVERTEQERWVITVNEPDLRQRPEGWR